MPTSILNQWFSLRRYKSEDNYKLIKLLVLRRGRDYSLSYQKKKKKGFMEEKAL